MDERVLLIVCFGIGIALEALLLQHADWRPGRLLGCLALAALGAVPGKHETVYQPLTHVLLVFSMFSVIFAMAFKEDILPAIGEKLLLSYTLIFWFGFFSTGYRGTVLHNSLLALLLVPTAATIYVACRRPTLTFTLKLLLYSWFLCMVVGLGLFQFPLYQFELFMQTQQVPWVTPFESVTAGMAFLYLAANATYVFYLVPIPGKNESWAQRMQHWHAFTDLMTERFADDVTMHRATLVLLCAQFVVLALDYRYRWFPSGALINFLIVLPGAILFARRFQLRRSDAPVASKRSVDH